MAAPQVCEVRGDGLDSGGGGVTQFGMKHLIFLTLLASPAFAQTCPPAPDRSEQAQTLMAALQHVGDEKAARVLTNQLWEIWATAPDTKAQALLDHGMQRRQAYDFEAALAAFEELVVYCPDYAEGYNQRAFINFIRQDYGNALEDLERALERSPMHIAALAGKALTLMQLGRIKAGQTALREALTLNPWLPERGMLIAEPGEDI